MPALRITFSKKEGSRFLSHLDLMATLEYAIRRAHLPVELSEGFNPRPRMSLAAPLALGYVGEAELLDLMLRERVAPEDVCGRLQAVLPKGISVIGAEELPPGKKAAARVAGAMYRVDLEQPVADLQDRVNRMMQSTSLPLEDHRDDRRHTRDLRPLLLDVTASDAKTLAMHVRLGDGGTVRPEQLLEILGISTDGVTISRERIELTSEPNVPA